MGFLITKAKYYKKRCLKAIYQKAIIFFNRSIVGIANANSTLHILYSQLDKDNLKKQESYVDLVRLSRSHNNFQLINIGLKHNNLETIGIGENQVWVVVKTLKEQHLNEYNLQEGDYIKLGRVRFKIKEIKLNIHLNEQKKCKIINQFRKELMSDQFIQTSNDMINP